MGSRIRKRQHQFFIANISICKSHRRWEINRVLKQAQRKNKREKKKKDKPFPLPPLKCRGNQGWTLCSMEDESYWGTKCIFLGVLAWEITSSDTKHLCPLLFPVKTVKWPQLFLPLLGITLSFPCKSKSNLLW